MLPKVTAPFLGLTQCCPLLLVSWALSHCDWQRSLGETISTLWLLYMLTHRLSRLIAWGRSQPLTTRWAILPAFVLEAFSEASAPHISLDHQHPQVFTRLKCFIDIFSLRPRPSYQSITVHLSVSWTIQVKPLPTSLNNLCASSASFPSKSILLLRLSSLPALGGSSPSLTSRTISEYGCNTLAGTNGIDYSRNQAYNTLAGTRIDYSRNQSYTFFLFQLTDPSFRVGNSHEG